MRLVSIEGVLVTKKRIVISFFEVSWTYLLFFEICQVLIFALDLFVDTCGGLWLFTHVVTYYYNILSNNSIITYDQTI